MAFRHKNGTIIFHSLKQYTGKQTTIFHISEAQGLLVFSLCTISSQHTWCALHIRSMSCLCKNLATTSAPNVNETPRSFSPQPSTSLSGSAHSRSHNKPWSGTSVGRITLRICSIDCRSGERPGEKINRHQASHFVWFLLSNVEENVFH